MRSIVVPATDEGLDSVNEFVGVELARFAVPPKTLNRIEVAIEEIMVNISSYAQLSDGDGVEVRCDVLDDPLRVVLQFLDRGIPFDPLASADPDISPEALEEREGGLGIFMVRQFMDSVTYAYENGKNTLTILKNLA